MKNQRDRETLGVLDGPTSNLNEEPSDMLFQYATRGEWDLFLQRCQTHPQDAHRVSSRENGCTPFHAMLLMDWDDIPFECFEAVMKAHPAATVAWLSGPLTPLHVVSTKLFDDMALEIFNLILVRCTPPPLNAIQSMLSSVTPDIPADVVKQHVYPFLGNGATVLTRSGFSALHCMIQNYDKYVKTEALEALLKKHHN